MHRLLILAVVAVGIAPAVSEGSIYHDEPVSLADLQGFRSTDLGLGVTGTEHWSVSGTGFRIEWNIQQIGTDFYYQYFLTSNTLKEDAVVPKNGVGTGWKDYDPLGSEGSRELSHWTLSITDDASQGDFWGFNITDYADLSRVDWNALYLNDKGNETPFLELITDSHPNNEVGGGYGIKFDYEALHFSFYSTRSPVWGDFFAIDGKVAGGGGDVMAYNIGHPDFSPPTLFDTTNYIVVPNSIGEPGDPGSPPHVIPEPASVLVWGGIGIAAAAGAALRRRRQMRQKGRWTPEQREAIYNVVSGGRHNRDN